MKHIQILICIAILLSSCRSSDTKEKNKNTFIAEEKPAKSQLKEVLTQKLFDLELGTGMEEILVDKNDLFGKFHQDRTEFYIIENPRLYISKSEVKELTLYFVDGILCKKKFELYEDIGNELIKSYGGFYFIPKSYISKEIALSDKILTRESNLINKNLTSFELKWKKEYATLRYEHLEDSAKDQFFFHEELPEYRYLLANAEYGK